MAVIAHVALRGVTRDQYDAVRAAAGWLASPPSGGLSHVTWWEGAVCHNLDAWESEAAFAAFSEQRLAPAMAAAGVSAEPEVTFHPAHEVFLPTAQRITATAAEGPEPTDNVALVRSGYDAFARGDVPSVLALFDPAIDWYTPDTIRFGGRASGPDGVAAFFSRLPENYTELRVEPERFVAAGDTVVAIGRHVGRTTAGTAFEIPFVHLWRFAGGKATSFYEHFDTVRMSTALGVVAQAGAPVAPAPAR